MELVARIKAQLRRFHQLGTDSREENKGQIVLKDLIINPAEHTVQRDGEFIAFTPKEFEILLLLAQNPNMVFSSEAIFERVWGLDSLGQDNTVMVHIRRIRSKLGDMPRESKYIHTVWGVGYKVEKSVSYTHLDVYKRQGQEVCFMPQRIPANSSWSRSTVMPSAARAMPWRLPRCV